MMNKALLGTLLVLPLAVFAAEAKKAEPVKTTEKVAQAAQPAQTQQKAAEAKEVKEVKGIAKSEITLEGAKAENRMEIEKLAKEAGAHHANYNVKTGVLRVSPMKKFDETKFVSSLEKQLPGVTLKK